MAASPAPVPTFIPRQPKRVIVSLAVNFELNTSNGLRRVIFGLEKDTRSTDVEWQIHFCLFERSSRTDDFGDPIVKVDVDVHSSLNSAAEQLAQSRPTPEQAGEIVGPMADDAKAFNNQEISKADFNESALMIFG